MFKLVCKKCTYALWKQIKGRKAFITKKGVYFCGGTDYQMNRKFITLTSK